MNRYAILLGKPAPKPAPQPKIKYYMGMDVGTRDDGTVIAISHFEKDKIIIDYAGRSSSDQIPRMLNSINQKYPIAYGLRDLPEYGDFPTPFKIEFECSSLRQKIKQVFDANKNRMFPSLTSSYYSRQMTQDMLDALARSVYLTAINRMDENAHEICFFDSST